MSAGGSLLDVPASFRPPSKARRQLFTDEPLLEVPPGGMTEAKRLAAMTAEALVENPEVERPVPWDRASTKKGRGRRRPVEDVKAVVRR